MYYALLQWDYTETFRKRYVDMHDLVGSAVAMLPSRNYCFYFTNLCLLLVAIACLLYVLIGLIQQDKPMIL